MVKDHSYSERGNLLPPLHGLVVFHMHHPIDRIAHTTAFVTVVDHWLEQEIAQWIFSIRTEINSFP